MHFNNKKERGDYMKCLSCGAETEGQFCEYCGNEMSNDHTDMNDGIGKCPKCSNSNITFKRERVGTERQYRSRKNYIGTGRQGKSISRSTYRTIGVCQSCGYTWNPNATKSGSNNKIWLWVLGWIFFFPLPLTILLLRKKDMKPVLKYGSIAIAWILFLSIGMFGNTEPDNSQTNPPSNNQGGGNISTGTNNQGSGNISTGTNDETDSLDIILNNYIGDIVREYNSKESEKLVYVENFTPSDKNSGHYRTEFRLSAYKEAVGKSYLLGGKVVDIVVHNNAYRQAITCRIYTNDTSLDQTINLIKSFSPILDNSLTSTKLQEVINELSTKKTANGYYFGKLGITLFGNDDEGYELMLKTD